MRRVEIEVSIADTEQPRRMMCAYSRLQTVKVHTRRKVCASSHMAFLWVLVTLQDLKETGPKELDCAHRNLDLLKVNKTNYI